MKSSKLVPGAAAMIAAASLSSSICALFTGPYAPGTWTITGAGIGGSSAVFAPTGKTLTITGSDGGFGSTISATHAVIGGGTFSFDWTYSGFDTTAGFDTAYYLIDDTKFLLSDAIGVPAASGTVTVPVSTGQIIGWQVVTDDGLFGPGVLTIETYPPAPGALALFGIAGLVRSRRRG